VNERDLTVSFNAVVCGVVMRTEDGVVGRTGVGVNNGWRWVRREMCSSEVPTQSAEAH
jgi:hypothetical protein